MPRKPVTFMGKLYKTQGEFEKYVRKVIYEDIGPCLDIQGTYPLQYDTLIKILERHPDFTSKAENMCNVKIVRDTLNRKALKMLITKKDGEEVDISWKCAITGEHKPDKGELMSAMRSSIDKQIYQFKTENKNKFCELCGSTENLQVDHNDEVCSAFDELVLNFVSITNKENIRTPNKFGETNDDTHRRSFLEIDRPFKNRWIEYHGEHASLRILCQNCNINRPKTKFKLRL